VAVNYFFKPCPPFNAVVFLRGKTVLSWVFGLMLTCGALARTQPQMLFVTQENCKLIRGYGKNDIAGVSKEFEVPASKIRYLRAEWGRGQEGFGQCNLVFATPKGDKSCKVFNIMKDEFVFALAVPIPGNHAICN
jgi:hypothetical protein